MHTFGVTTHEHVLIIFHSTGPGLTLDELLQALTQERGRHRGPRQTMLQYIQGLVDQKVVSHAIKLKDKVSLDHSRDERVCM